MKQGPSIQHKASFKTEAGFAFEDGNRVPITQPDIGGDPAPVTLAELGIDSDQLLGILLHDARKGDEIIGRALTLGMFANHPDAPKNPAEFSRWFPDISESTARRRWQELSQYIQGELKIFDTSHP